MPCLRQLLTAHAPLLWLDAASTKIQVGWLTGETATTRWAVSEAEAGVGLFQGLTELGVKPQAAGAFVFSDGPGSVLGIRTVAMAVRAWCVLAPRPVFRYHSLALVAHALGRPDIQIIADARRDAWHVQTLDSPLRRVATADLAGACATPTEFRHWSPLPPGAVRVPYSVADLLARVEDGDLFSATAEPDAFLHEEPSYVTWTPQIHRAP